MEFLGIGPLEIFFILLLTLIVIGPKDMVKSGRTIGRTLRKIVTSQQWQMVTRTSREIRNIPNRLIREAGLEEMQQDVNALKQTTSEIQNTLRESTILPPSWKGQPLPKQGNSTSGKANPGPSPASNFPSGPADTSDHENLTIPGPAMPQNRDLSAWTDPSAGPESAASDSKQTGQADDLSAWVLPPASSQAPTSKH